MTAADERLERSERSGAAALFLHNPNYQVQEAYLGME